MGFEDVMDGADDGAEEKRSGLRVSLLEEARPVFHASGQHSAVDEVELIVKSPVGFGVIDQET